MSAPRRVAGQDGGRKPSVAPRRGAPWTDPAPARQRWHFPHWQEVPLSTKWQDLEGASLLIFADGDDRGCLARPSAPTHNDWQVDRGLAILDETNLSYVRTDRPESPTTLQMRCDAAIGPKARDLVGPQAKVVAIPPIDWTRVGEAAAWRTPAMIVVALAIAVPLMLAGQTGMALAIPAAALGAFLTWLLARRSGGLRIRNPGEYSLDASNVVEYASRRLAGESPGFALAADRRAAALTRADEIKAEYGELLSDIVYRIDYPALFDTAVPATEQFHSAMVRFEGADTMGLTELEALVNELEIAYSLARDNAETLGERHLPEHTRAAARRASKAAHLAANAATDGERDASLAQVRRILASLALYYLPTIDEEPRALER